MTRHSRVIKDFWDRSMPRFVSGLIILD